MNHARVGSTRRTVKGSKVGIAEPLLHAAAEEGGDGKVVLLGIAQEKASAWRLWKKKRQQEASHPRMERGNQMVLVNHFYFYRLWDPEWGPAFWKTNTYAPYPIWLWLNGHSWAKRQLQKAGIAFEALDNGFRSCALMVLLITIAAHRVLFGLLLIVAFSTGLAAVLVGVGLLLVYARGVFARVNPSSGLAPRLLPVASALVIVVAGGVITAQTLPQVL